MSNAVHSYRRIGQGHCGSVWALPDDDDDDHVIKRGDCTPFRSILNDYGMHLRITQTLTRHPLSTPLTIPGCFAFVQSTDQDWWSQRLHRFPAGFEACQAIVTERIPHVPRHVSNEIVDIFIPGNIEVSQFVKTNPDDVDCLIRAYLGRRRQRTSMTNSRFKLLSLRNVPLHVNQMEDMDLDIDAYADTMVGALAQMHWAAQVDARDVEFVLAPPRSVSPSSASFSSPFLGDHCLWLLDFDCCRAMPMDAAGIEQACDASYRNDPFYPRPDWTESADKVLWERFKRRFLETSRGILGERSEFGELPWKLMGRIEEVGRERQRRKEEVVKRDDQSLGL